MEKITVEKFREILPLICDCETSSDPGGWTAENPLWGNCAVVALVAQNLFGGDYLLKVSLENTKFAKMRSHYFNRILDGAVIDFTKMQFSDEYPFWIAATERKREDVLSIIKYPDTARRYKLLAWRLAKFINKGNTLFEDTIYRKCFDAALDSECQKMKFGCVITHNSEVVYEGCNKIIEPLRKMCQPKCIRFCIQSRTESMLGACGHAEEWGLWNTIHQGIAINECELYVAGFFADGMPWLKHEIVHSCLRCAVQMYNAKLKQIFVPFGNQWAGMTTDYAVETARAYATQERKV